MSDPDGSMFAWPQVPTLGCCLCLLLSMFHYTHSCASKPGMVHTHFGMPSQACVSIHHQLGIRSQRRMKRFTRSLQIVTPSLQTFQKSLSPSYTSLQHASSAIIQQSAHPHVLKANPRGRSNPSLPPLGGREEHRVWAWGPPRVGLPME